MFERIVYVSRATAGVGPRDAYDIIRVAHNRNSRFGLTGALLMIDGYFVQVLEGAGYALNERFAAIARDPRHAGLQVRQRIATPRLLFPTEWMALREGDGIDAATRRDFGCVDAFRADDFDGGRLVAFTQACCAAAAA